MNHLRSICCFAILVLVSKAAQASENSHITHITLYPGSATIERTAHVSMGSRQLLLTGLPASFDLQTIKLEADTGIHLGDFTVRDVASTETINPHQSELEQKIQTLDDQIGKLDIERQSAELVTGYLKGLGTPAPSGFAASSSNNLATTLEAIRRGGSDAYTRILQANIKKRALLQQKKAFQSDLNQIISLNRNTRSIDLNLSADHSGDIRISYQISGPGWQPTYRAMLNTTESKISLFRQALIAQNSGEDWKDVSLSLSTGRPHASVIGPTVLPWTLSLRPPERMTTMEAMAPLPMLARSKSMRKSSQPLFEVKENQSGFATEFSVPVKITLPSDGRKVTIQLSHQRMNVTQSVQVIPRISTTAYLLAYAERPQGVWLPGELQLYRDGDYVGSTHWNPQHGDNLEFPFGQDDLVQITVAHPKAITGSTGLIGTRKEQQLTDVYSVRSRHHQSIDLLLLEPTPVSTNKDIQVDKDFTPSPTLIDWGKYSGVMAWETQLSPGQDKTFTMNYRITWPEDTRIDGLH